MEKRERTKFPQKENTTTNKAKFEEKGFFKNIESNTGTGLSGRFIFPPFTVLRTTDGNWQRRKRQWLRLGIQSEVGRGDDPNLVDSDFYANKGKVAKSKANVEEMKLSDGTVVKRGSTGTSVFDPVLCELMYSWFCPPHGQTIDPFAGGSVRGIVAHYMGYRYWGCELREEQVEANIQQGEKILPNDPPKWICGDSVQELEKAPKADFVFSCPPYGDLEVYSDLESDISNKDYSEFLVLYEKIIQEVVARLKTNRFACFVVGNYRDKNGFYYDLVGDTVRSFERAGLHFYNDAVLLTAIGTLPLRTGKQFNAGRKLGKAHQNILVFYKGNNPGRIKKVFNTDEKTNEI